MRKINPIDSLLPKICQKILAATYLQPQKWWFLSELAKHLKTSPSSLQRELDSLISSGILRSRRDGNRLYFQAETDSPIFAALSELIARTLGIEPSLKELLLPLAKKIKCAFIFGSVARREDRVTSDVDLMVIGSAGLAEFVPIIRKLEREFGREINPVCYGPSEFKKKLADGNHFLTSVMKSEKMFLAGDEDELARLAGQL